MAPACCLRGCLMSQQDARGTGSTELAVCVADCERQASAISPAPLPAAGRRLACANSARKAATRHAAGVSVTDGMAANSSQPTDSLVTTSASGTMGEFGHSAASPSPSPAPGSACMGFCLTYRAPQHEARRSGIPSFFGRPAYIQEYGLNIDSGGCIVSSNEIGISVRPLVA